MEHNQVHDVIVIGGGAAGLNAALTLGRARRTVLLIDAGQQRNAPAHSMHNYLGHEGIAPADFLCRRI
ncbi:FAD-dependent oxidoreductase [Streptomyces sp. NPDC088921]|uniref:FAD-dependent oxidoreductase n=1 Tax=unclassified Streptomyces TaxID=2593676 RepID=UPI00341C1BF9